MPDDEQVGAIAFDGRDEGVLGSAHRHGADRKHTLRPGGRDGGLELGRARLVLVQRPFGVTAAEDRYHVEQAELGSAPGGERARE
jgi:hypothetical protein